MPASLRVPADRLALGVGQRAVGARRRDREPHHAGDVGRQHQRRRRRSAGGRDRTAGRRPLPARRGRLEAVVEPPRHPDGGHQGTGGEEAALPAQEVRGPARPLASRSPQRATQEDAEQLIAVQCHASATEYCAPA